MNPCRNFILLILFAIHLFVSGCSESMETKTVKFFKAAKTGDTRTVADLLDKGVNVDTLLNPDGWTALHFASANGHLETVKVLLAAGAKTSISGIPPGKSTGGTEISSTPLLQAQVGLYFWKMNRNPQKTHVLNDNPEVGSLPDDADGERRYEEIINLLQKANSK